MKLTLDLVPQSCFFSNLRSELPKSDWDRLRKKQYKKADYRCEICGGQGTKHRVECHELWSYDEDRGVQVLEGLIALCPSCHEVKHMGLTATRGRREPALRQLMKVNGMSRQAGISYCVAEFSIWKQRSQRSWSLDLTWLEGQVVNSAKKIEEARRARNALNMAESQGDFADLIAQIEAAHGPTPEGFRRLAFEHAGCGHASVVEVPDLDRLEPGQAVTLMEQIAEDAQGLCPTCQAESEEPGQAPPPMPTPGPNTTPDLLREPQGSPGPQGRPQGPQSQNGSQGGPQESQGSSGRTITDNEGRVYELG